MDFSRHNLIPFVSCWQCRTLENKQNKQVLWKFCLPSFLFMNTFDLVAVRSALALSAHQCTASRSSNKLSDHYCLYSSGCLFCLFRSVFQQVDHLECTSLQCGLLFKGLAHFGQLWTILAASG